ncbi:T9SS type A sorting domain-containing protein [Winogradskyella sp. HB-48]|uniref:T9SS type A sorting domain-containing protein n=1 Tax=Winogradskyella sp. HB-48 TaxID=3416808 RepID=UPI003CEC464A
MKKKLLVFFLMPFVSLSQVQIGQDILGETIISQFGTSVDISIDGNIVAVGAPRDNDNGFEAGDTKLYRLINNSWIQIGDDIEGEAANNDSGLSISLSDDGSIVAIGAPGNTTENNGTGHIRVFQNINDIWTQVGSDIDATPNLNEQLGKRVSLSSDGTILAALAHNNFNHFVRVFQFNNGLWTQVGQDIFEGYELDSFGHYISLSSDGSTLAIGNRDASIGFNRGRVRVYENINNTWTQVGQDLEGDFDGDYFGSSVTLSTNNNILAVGVSFSNINGSDSGQVKVYQNINNVWTQIGQDVNGDANNDKFGTSISLSSNGYIMAIGAPNNSSGGGFSGQIKVYQYDGLNWNQIGTDIIGNSSDQLGISVALSGDGSRLIGGAATASPNNSSGLARVYDLSSLLSTNEQNITDFRIYPNPTKNQFIVQSVNPYDLRNVNVYDNLGKLVLTSKETIINTSGLSSGLYTVEVETTKTKGIKKFIIE